jgi:ribosome-associated toxin RatA of RatAB toxin-antitoxin module
MRGASPTCQIRRSVEILRPPDDVWRLLGDFEDVEAWASSITSSRRTTGPEVGIGSRRTVRYRWVLRLEEAVTEWTEGRSLAYDVFGAPIPFRDFHETWRIDPSPVGATVTACVQYKVGFGVAGRLLNALLMRHVLKLEVWLGVRSLKRTVEARPATTEDAGEVGSSPSYSAS